MNGGINTQITEYLRQNISPDRILIDEEMSKHTTFRVGGKADVLIKIADTKELVSTIAFLKRMEVPYFIKGNGSNLLVSDRGYQGAILEISECFNDITVEDSIIRAKSGALMSSIANEAYKNSLTGFEFASGIPGTIGGGVVMNAGAYDGELKDVIKKVSVIDEQGQEITLDNASMMFGYRSSIIKQRPFIVTEVIIELVKGDPKAIKEKMDDLNQKRRLKQPLDYPSAGSTFKRPEGYFAGKLIMDAGLRGFTLGGAAVSEKHCGFVINKQKASASDIYELIKEVEDRVNSKFGVILEPEVIFLGEF